LRERSQFERDAEGTDETSVDEIRRIY